MNVEVNTHRQGSGVNHSICKVSTLPFREIPIWTNEKKKRLENHRFHSILPCNKQH